MPAPALLDAPAAPSGAAAALPRIAAPPAEEAGEPFASLLANATAAPLLPGSVTPTGTLDVGDPRGLAFGPALPTGPILVGPIPATPPASLAGAEPPAIDAARLPGEGDLIAPSAEDAGDSEDGEDAPGGAPADTGVSPALPLGAGPTAPDRIAPLAAFAPLPNAPPLPARATDAPAIRVAIGSVPTADAAPPEPLRPNEKARAEGTVAGPPRTATPTVADDPSAPGNSSEIPGLVAISGGAQSRAGDEGGEGRDDRDAPPEPLLAPDRPADLAPVGTAKTEARPALSAGERARVVHQIVAKVAARVEGLAAARSREPLEIRLEPADLGRIVVTLARDAGGLAAEMSASDPRVSEALERHRGELTGALAARVQTEVRVTVTPMTESATPRFDFANGGQNPNPQGRSAPASPHATPSGETAVIPTSRTLRRPRASGLDLEI